MRSYSKKKKELEFTPQITEINVTPLVDVCLVLVIIFLALAPAIYLSGITITRAKTSAAEPEQVATEVKVNIFLSTDNKIMLNEEEVSEFRLPELVRALLLRSVSKTVTISADRQVKHQKLVWVLDLARQCGATNLCILKRRTPDRG